MSHDHFHSSPSLPHFESKLPPGLLDGLDERDKFLYKESDRNRQMMEWLVERSMADSHTLAEVKTQVLRTNGRMLTAESDIRNLKQSVEVYHEEVQPVVKAYTVAGKLVRSRTFWGCTALFVLFGLPWLIIHAPAPAVLLKWALGIGTLGL